MCGRELFISKLLCFMHMNLFISTFAKNCHQEMWPKQDFFKFTYTLIFFVVFQYNSFYFLSLEIYVSAFFTLLCLLFWSVFSNSIPFSSIVWVLEIGLSTVIHFYVNCILCSNISSFYLYLTYVFNSLNAISYDTFLLGFL